jgi:hypothetical protein
MIQWHENHSGELYFVVAERANSEWTLSERSTFEVRWYPCKMTAERGERLKGIMERGPEQDPLPTHAGDRLVVIAGSGSLSSSNVV